MEMDCRPAVLSVPVAHTMGMMTDPKLRAIAAGAALFGALVVQILTPFLAWRWSQQPFLGALLAHTLVVSTIESHWAGAAAGLTRTDRVIAVDGHPVSGGRGLETILQQQAPDEPIALTVSASTGNSARIRELEVLPQSFAASDWIAYFVTPYIVGLCYLGIGIWSLSRQPVRSQTQIFGLSCAGASILLSSRFDTLTTYALTRVWTAAWPLTGIGVFLLGLSFAAEARLWARVRRWQLLSLLPATAILAWGQIALYGPNPRSYLLPWSANVAFVAASLLALAAVLIHVRLRPSYVRVRLEAQWTLLGATISLLPLLIWALVSVLRWLVPSLRATDSIQLQLLFLIAFPVAVGYALHHHRPLEVDAMLSPLYRDRWRSHAALHDFGRALAGSLDPHYILDTLLAQIGALLRPRRILAFMASPAGSSYELYTTWGQVDAASVQDCRLAAHDKIISRLQRNDDSTPLVLEAITALRLGPQEYALLQSLQVALLVPLRSKDYLLGVLALGHTESGDLYGQDEISLLQTIVDQAAIAAENALLYARQVEQERRLVQQTRQLTDILSLGNELKSLDRDIVVQSTVDAVFSSLGFDFVTLSLVEENDPIRLRVVAWAGIESQTWERLAQKSFPLIDMESADSVRKLGHCYLMYASETEPEISSAQRPVPWREGDQLFVPLTSNEDLLGYLIVDRPRDHLHPTEETLEVLEIFANQAAIAIQNANLYAAIDWALDERVAELATLQEIDRQINLKLDFQHVMDMTLEWAMRITGAAAGTLCLVSEDQQALQAVAHRGYPPQIEPYWDTPWPIQEGLMGDVVRTGEPVLIENVAQHSTYIDSVVSTRSHLAVPITREDQIIGVISLESAEPTEFSADHLAFLMRLADHATVAIENARLFEQSNRRVDELSALQRISLDLTSHLDLNSVLESIAANARTLIRADQVTIYLYDEHKDVLAFGTGLSKQGQEDRPPIPIHRNQLTTTVVRQGKPVVIHDSRHHPLLSGGDWPVHAMASIPLQKAGHVLGAFDITFEAPHTFTPDELRVLNLLADQAAIAVDNAQLYDNARRANKVKNEFIDAVSREFRAPMTSAQGYAKLLTIGAGGALTEQQEEFATTILRNMEHMSNQIADLVNISRIESGKIKITPTATDLSRLVREVVGSMQGECESRGHRIEIDLADDLPDVHIDSSRIARVWANLLDNAFRYTPHGGQITLRAQRHAGLDMNAAKGQWVLCAVQDSGVGIPSEDQERIFEAFHRVQNPDIQHEQGNGLGLAVVRSIVEMHGGHVWVESEPGQGSTFYFTLPSAQESAR